MSLLWVTAGGIELEHPLGKTVQVPIQHILDHYRPTEGDNWDSVRDYFEDEHPVMMKSLGEDIRDRGVRRPIEAYADGDQWAVHNGHHRILKAEDEGVRTVPVVHYEHPHDIPGDKEYWSPETKEHYGPDEDEDDEGQLRY